jgi:hypothetical protein
MTVKELKKEYSFICDVIEFKGKWDYEEYCEDECCIDCLICIEDCHCDESSGSQWETKLKFINNDNEIELETIAVIDDKPLIFNIDFNKRGFITEIIHDLYIFDDDKICDGVYDGYYKFEDF